MDNNPKPKVGYKMPPEKTRFKKGMSGNPAGRPKSSKTRSFLAEIEEELNSMISVTIGTKTQMLSLRRIIGKTLVREAVEGNHKARLLVMQVTASQESSGKEALAPILRLMEDAYDSRVAADASDRSVQEDGNGA